MASSVAWAGSNLVVNGHFGDTNEFLRGWKYNYEDTGKELIKSNHFHVAITNEGSKKHVLALTASASIFGTQGVLVDSAPVPFTPGARYKLTVSAKTTKPNCRIQLDGYRWRPGVKPHANPTLNELRKCYRFPQIYFVESKTGVMGGIGPNMDWVTASTTFPTAKMSKMAQENFNQIQFMVVHIIALCGIWGAPDGHDVGTLYVDDVELKRIN